MQLKLSSQERLEEYKALINAQLDEYTKNLGDHCPDILLRAMRYSLLQSGKRIRPLLTLLASDVCNGDIHDALPVACAVEMVHCFSLIHDDLPAMDDDDLRRGQPTSHKVFGEDQAILAGDALLAFAFDVIASDMKSDTAAECCKVLARASGPMGMTGGQSDDVGNGVQKVSIEDIRFLHLRKTGALIDASVHMGCIAAYGTEKQTDALRLFATHLGILFQITDDVLDLEGSESETGKAVGKDAEKGKETYTTLLGISEARAEAEREKTAAMDALSVFGEEADILRNLASSLLNRSR